MSGMFDTKTDKVKRKQELTLKETKARRKRRTITVSVTVGFLLIAAIAMLINSNLLRRTLPVVTIDGVSFNTAQFEYFFNEELNIAVNELYSLNIDFPPPDYNRPLSRQPYFGSADVTWADYITERTLASLQEMVAIYNIAMADDSFELSPERYEGFSGRLDMYAMDAIMYGFPSTESYLQRLYGTGINEQILLEIFEFIATADEYLTHKRDSFEYTDEQADEFYAENADDFDILRYRMFTVTADLPASDDEDYDTLFADAMREARNIAETYVAGIESEDDFLDAALDYNDVWYTDPSFSLLERRGSDISNVTGADVYIAPWLLDSGRQPGDVTAIETHTGTAVLYFLSRDDNNYRTLSMRQLLIIRENVSPFDYDDGEDDPEYIEAKELAEREARERAEAADALFTEAGRTEDALLGLMEEHSDDTTEGGFYENIARFSYRGETFSTMRLVPEIEDWIFDEGRVVGDSQLIESEAHGLHLVYFTGFGDVFSQMIARDKMRTNDRDEWVDNLNRAEPVKTGWFILVTM